MRFVKSISASDRRVALLRDRIARTAIRVGRPAPFKGWDFKGLSPLHSPSLAIPRRPGRARFQEIAHLRRFSDGGEPPPGATKIGPVPCGGSARIAETERDQGASVHRDQGD